jgi:hypothetical protein
MSSNAIAEILAVFDDDPEMTRELLAIERDQHTAESHAMVRIREIALQATKDRAEPPPSAVDLLRKALRLRMNGERAPGGSETWRDWDLQAEAYLRGFGEGADRVRP